jgi:hypothetical protein
VAIKRLTTAAAHEADLLCQFRHRNIVQCLGVCVLPPHHLTALVMEYAPENLKQALHRRDVPPAMLVEWALQIATGTVGTHGSVAAPVWARGPRLTRRPQE